MSLDSFINEIDGRLWYIWLPCVLMSVYSLGVKYSLGAPRSLGSRISRTLAFMAHIMNIFSPLNVNLLLIAYPLLLLSHCVLNTQFYLEEQSRKRLMRIWNNVRGRRGESTTEKVVTALVDPPNKVRR